MFFVQENRAFILLLPHDQKSQKKSQKSCLTPKLIWWCRSPPDVCPTLLFFLWSQTTIFDCPVLSRCDADAEPCPWHVGGKWEHRSVSVTRGSMWCCTPNMAKAFTEFSSNRWRWRFQFPLLVLPARIPFLFLPKLSMSRRLQGKGFVWNKRDKGQGSNSSEHHLILLKQICYFGCLKKEACLLDKPEWFQRNDYNLSHQVILKRVSIQPIVL